MLGRGGNEKKVACVEGVPLAIVKKNASPANYDVCLVLFVRRLFIGARRCSELDVEGATLQNADGALVRQACDARLSLGKTDHTATHLFAHDSHLVLSNDQAQR
jgi:hypothetical protein